MLLAIDIGNTTIALGKFDRDGLCSVERTFTEKIISADAAIESLKKIPDIQAIDNIAVCSVVPNLTPLFVDAVRKLFGIDAWIFDHTANLGMKILYDDPSQLGADRLANAYAAFRLYGAPVIAVDLGTANKFDVVNAHGEYAGGAIAPGVIISAQALFNRGARLFEVDLKPPSKSIGTNTTEAMQSGIFYGAVGQIDYLIARIKLELSEPRAMVIATGGFAEIITPYCSLIKKIDPALTLQGIRLGWEKSR